MKPATRQEHRWSHHLNPARKGMAAISTNIDWQMIVFDIDGTLLDINGFQAELIPLIRELENRGISVSLASGRTLPNVTPIQQSLAVSGFVIGVPGLPLIGWRRESRVSMPQGSSRIAGVRPNGA